MNNPYPQPKTYLQIIHRGKLTEDIPYTEFHDVGKPSPNLGKPGDAYVDITPKNYSLYGKLASGWTKWSGPENSYLPYLVHPSLDSFILWCNPEVGVIGWKSRAKVTISQAYRSTSIILATALNKRLEKKRKKSFDTSCNPPSKKQNVYIATNGQHANDDATQAISSIPQPIGHQDTLSRQQIVQTFTSHSTASSPLIPQTYSGSSSSSLSSDFPSLFASRQLTEMSYTPYSNASSSTPPVPTHLIGSSNYQLTSPAVISNIPMDDSSYPSIDPLSTRSEIQDTPLVCSSDSTRPKITDTQSFTTPEDLARHICSLINNEPPNVPALRYITRWTLKEIHRILLIAKAGEKTIIQLQEDNKNLKRLKEEEEQMKLKAENELKLQRALFVEVCDAHHRVAEENAQLLRLKDEVARLEEQNSRLSVFKAEYLKFKQEAEKSSTERMHAEQSLWRTVFDVQSHSEASHLASSPNESDVSDNSARPLSTSIIVFQTVELELRRLHEENKSLKQTIADQQLCSKSMSNSRESVKPTSTTEILESASRTPAYRDMSAMTKISSTRLIQSHAESLSISTHTSDTHTQLSISPPCTIGPTIDESHSALQITESTNMLHDEIEQPIIIEETTRCRTSSLAPAEATSSFQLQKTSDSNSDNRNLHQTPDSARVDDRELQPPDNAEVELPDECSEILNEDQLNIIFWKKEGHRICRICLATKIMEHIEIPISPQKSSIVLSEHCVTKHGDILDVLRSLTVEDMILLNDAVETVE